MPLSEKETKSKKQRLEMLHYHRPGCKFPMIEELTEELSDFFDVTGITKVVTNIYRYFYDHNNRTDDPVGFLKSLVKARKKDQRELHKAKRKWYRLLWKEWEVKDEITKLKTLLGALAPEVYTHEGEPKPKVDNNILSSEALTEKMEDSCWMAMHPKMQEHYEFTQLELQIIKLNHIDQSALMSEQQAQIEELHKQQQHDIQTLLDDFDLQIKSHKSYLSAVGNRSDQAKANFDPDVLQLYLGQMLTVQRNQIKALHSSQYQSLMTQHNLQRHERVQKLVGEGTKQQVCLHNMMMAQGRHEQLRMEHQDQMLEFVDEIQEHQQKAFDESLAILTNLKNIGVRESPEQIMKRTHQQLQQLHEKQVQQLLVLQNQELHTLDRLHKVAKKDITRQIKLEQQNLPKQAIHDNMIHHQNIQINKLIKRNEENKELINIINKTIDGNLEVPTEDDDNPLPPMASSKSEEVLNSINQMGGLQERMMRLHQQMVQQELHHPNLPKVPDVESHFRKIQDVISQQQRRIQQQFRQQYTLRSILEHLYELVIAQSPQDQGQINPYRSSQVQILQDCQEFLKKALNTCEKQRCRNSILKDIEEDVNTFQAAYWKKREKMNEPIDDMGKSLLRGKLVRGNKKELHPLQKLLFEIQNMQQAHVTRHQTLTDINKKNQAASPQRPQIEQDRKQQEKLILQIIKDTEDLEDEQYEDRGALDVQQNQIDATESIQLWMKGITRLQEVLVEKCYEKGVIHNFAHEISEMEPLFQLTHSMQEHHLKMIIARQDELASSYQKIVKVLAPNQLALTEEQLRRQRSQLNQLKCDLQNCMEFTNPYKSIKIINESHSPQDELDAELKEMVDTLKSHLTSLSNFLKERQLQEKEKLEELAQQILRHQQKITKLSGIHDQILDQFVDLHLVPSKYFLADLLILHNRLSHCLKVQKQKLQHLMYRLRKYQDDAQDINNEAGNMLPKEKKEGEEKSEKRLKKKKAKSRASMSSLSSSFKGTVAKHSVRSEKGASDRAKISASCEQLEDLFETEDKIKSDIQERKRGLSRRSIVVTELELTEEQRETRERQRLITELKDKHAYTLQQVQLLNRPDIFRRVHTLTHARGTKPKKHEELRIATAEYFMSKPKTDHYCTPNQLETSVVEENQRQLFKLFEKSEKIMLDKGDSIRGSAFLKMLKDNIAVKDSSITQLNSDQSTQDTFSWSRGTLKK